MYSTVLNKCLMYRVSFNFHNSSLRYKLYLLLLTMIKLSSKSMNLPKIAKLVSNETRNMSPYLSNSRIYVLNYLCYSALCHNLINSPPRLWKQLCCFQLGATINNKHPCAQIVTHIHNHLLVKFSRRGIAASKAITRTRTNNSYIINYTDIYRGKTL